MKMILISGLNRKYENYFLLKCGYNFIILVVLENVKNKLINK